MSGLDSKQVRLNGAPRCRHCGGPVCGKGVDPLWPVYDTATTHPKCHKEAMKAKAEEEVSK